jgi:hypothetical protein
LRLHRFHPNLLLRDGTARSRPGRKKDYTLISGPANNQFPMLAERKADLVTISVEQAADPKIEAVTRTLFRVTDALGITQWSLYAMRKPFIEAHHA